MEFDSHDSREMAYIHYMQAKKTADLNLIQVGHHQTEPRYEYGPMIRDHFLIHFVVAGEGLFLLHNKKYVVQAGEAFVIRPYEIATYISDGARPWEYYWLGFSGEDGAEAIKRSGFSEETSVITVENMGKIEEAFRWVEPGNYRKENIFLYQSILYRVMHFLMNGNNGATDSVGPARRETSRTKQDYVERVVSIIETSYNQNVPVYKLAEMLSLSRNYLSRIFKDSMGVSIKDFLLDYRLNRAAGLMRDTSWTITQIAMETGFQDALYFSRLFKKRYGVAPTEYRSRQMAETH